MPPFLLTKKRKNKSCAIRVLIRYSKISKNLGIHKISKNYLHITTVTYYIKYITILKSSKINLKIFTNMLGLLCVENFLIS